MRGDGRTPREIRPLELQTSLLSRADGSAQFSFGNVRVLASVTGPIEARLRDEKVDKANLEINIVPLRGVPGLTTHETEGFLQSTISSLVLLNLYPRSLIQLTLQTVSSPSTAFLHAISTDPEVQKTGSPTGAAKGISEKAALINAAFQAIINAAVQCRGVAIAVAIAFIRNEHGDMEMFVDPSNEEEDASESGHLFVVSFGLNVGGTEGQVVGIDSVGSFTERELFDAHQLAIDSCRAILQFVRVSIGIKYGITKDEEMKE